MDTPSDINDILTAAKAEKPLRGKLKIFFGAMAGVGKTYSMLEAAKVRKKEGVDVVVGYVETHKRVETEALLQGFETLPHKKIMYRNIDLVEFDIDAALKRHPALILVDELAHTNVPGSRNLKRWQDVDELLDAGIDVYTTLNVQHCESANDIVAGITGVIVKETLPDTFLEQADDVELIDLPPEDLLKRLKDGKVYLGDQAERAIGNFFQIGNLIALRQLALQHTSRIVDARMRSYKKTYAISKVWNVRDRFLISISPSPTAVRLVRAGKRISASLGVEWIVAFVDNPSQVVTPKDRSRVTDMMRLAEKLGAETVTLSGSSVSDTLIEYARTRNITKIIVGKPAAKRFRDIFASSIIDELAHKCGEIDLYLISGENPEAIPEIRMAKLRPFSLKDAVWTACVLMVCTMVSAFLSHYVHLINLIMIYLLGVIWIAYRFGRRYAMIAAVLSVLVFDYFFVPPFGTFEVADVQYFITLIVMLIVGAVIGSLTGRLRQQTITMRLHESMSGAMYRLNRDLAKTSDPDNIITIAIEHIREFFKYPVIVFTREKESDITARFGDFKSLTSAEKAEAVAHWVIEHKKPAGKGTDTLPGARGIYLPLAGSEKVLGVIALYPDEKSVPDDPDKMHILEMFVNQSSLALEGALRARAVIKAESEIETERLRNMLLATFSLDLPGPLKVIREATEILLKPETAGDISKRNELIQTIRSEAERLNKLSVEMTATLVETKQ
ncbi:MAG: sensor histidine kinase KdpD [Candidatus Omnitrophica bacterium]|nr:sensor histidine kinase KdpD [Candidatus Omnitrophota bacterium]